MQVREQRMHSVLTDAAQANSVTDEQIKLLTAKQTRAVKRATTFLFQQQRQLDDFTLVDNPEISSKQLIESVQLTLAGLMLARSNVYDAYKSMTAPGPARVRFPSHWTALVQKLRRFVSTVQRRFMSCRPSGNG